MGLRVADASATDARVDAPIAAAAVRATSIKFYYIPDRW
jgi:hypothetical protein